MRLASAGRGHSRGHGRLAFSNAASAAKKARDPRIRLEAKHSTQKGSRTSARVRILRWIVGVCSPRSTWANWMSRNLPVVACSWPAHGGPVSRSRSDAQQQSNRHIWNRSGARSPRWWSRLGDQRMEARMYALDVGGDVVRRGQSRGAIATLAWRCSSRCGPASDSIRPRARFSMSGSMEHAQPRHRSADARRFSLLEAACASAACRVGSPRSTRSSRCAIRPWSSRT